MMSNINEDVFKKIAEFWIDKFKVLGKESIVNKFNEIVTKNYISDTEPNIAFIFVSIDFTSNSKFEQLINAMNNPFMTDPQKLRVLDVFCDVQKMVHSVYRLKNAWRFRRAKTYNTEDLLMNPISSRDKNTVTLLQNNTKYIFPIRELLQIIQNALSNCCHFFPDPLECKNPYTNLPFNKSAFYTIYFAARRSYLRMPILFDAFFHTNFNYNLFLTSNEELINDEYLQTYVENHCLNDILLHVQDMYVNYRYSCRIHPTFPKDKLVVIMKPYLSLYFISQYSLNEHKKLRARHKLRRKLRAFVEFNPNFGKKKVKMIAEKPFSSVKKCVYIFDDQHVPFIPSGLKEDFMKTHLDLPQPARQTNSQLASTPVLVQETSFTSVTFSDDDSESDTVFENNTVSDDSDDDEEEPIIIGGNIHFISRVVQEEEDEIERMIDILHNEEYDDPEDHDEEEAEL